MPVVTDEQRHFYEAEGYLLASELIAREIAAEATATMRRLLGIELDGIKPWEGPNPAHQVYEEPGLLACYTPEMCAAAARLAGGDAALFKPPTRAYAINVFPSAGPWDWSRPHIDHAIKERGRPVFPPPFRIAAMIYLNDVPPHGGGTIVWPGSHRKLENLAKSDPARYEMMWMLSRNIDEADLGAPVELTPRCGDVLFYDYLLAHSGSTNTSDRPRLALNMKW